MRFSKYIMCAKKYFQESSRGTSSFRGIRKAGFWLSFSLIVSPPSEKNYFLHCFRSQSSFILRNYRKDTSLFSW